MAYFIFLKNNADVFRIAENISDLNNLNISASDFNTIEDSQTNFDYVKYGTKYPESIQGSTITYVDIPVLPFSKELLSKYITNTKNIIKAFLENNPSHPLFNRWNDYYNQLSNLNLDTITYPLNTSLEQYFKDLSQPSFSPLQLP